jgi:hypothetical protein
MDFFIPILNTLAIAVVLILLMVGLVSAPWQLLLLILILGLLAYQWLIRRNHLQSVLQDLNSNTETNGVDSLERQAEETIHMVEPSHGQILHYRGISYPAPVSEPDAEPSHSGVEITGQYRGGLRKFFL